MAEPADTWRTDTTNILASGGTTVTVYSATYATDITPMVLTASAVVETATVMIFQEQGHQTLDKGPIGLQSDALYQLFFPYTSSVAVNHRIRETGVDDYYEVTSVEKYEDHNEVKARLVENRL